MPSTSRSRPAPEAELVDTVTAAQMLGLAPKTLECWRTTHRSPFPFYRVAKRVRYSVAELREYIEQQRTPCQPPTICRS